MSDPNTSSTEIAQGGTLFSLAEVSRLRDASARRSRIAPCHQCQWVHCAGDVVAVGRFDPNGVHGYVPRVGGCGCVYRTRDEAMAVVCAGRVGMAQ